MLHVVLPTNTKTQKYHLFTAKPPFMVKIIDCRHQTGLPSLSRCQSTCRKWQLFIKPGVSERELVGVWRPFCSTNMAISETKAQGWKVISTQWRKA